MSTLLIEGGRRLSGAVAVEGNKNAALPLLAACLLTTEECVLTNVPRISDVEVMARLLVDLGARGRGHRHARRCASAARRSSRTNRTARWSAGCAGRCCCSVRCWRGAAARGSRRRAATFPARRTIATHLEALVAMGARSARRARPRARGAGRPEADVDLPLRSVGHRHRDGAARRGRGARASPRSATPPASRTSSSCASSWRSWAPASPAPGTSTIRVEGGGTPARRRAPAVGRLHRGGQLGGRRGGHRRRDRGPRRARPRTSKSSPRC